MPRSPDWVTADNSALVTDLYEMTMAASYVASGLSHQATFDLFVRKLPAQRGFLVVCGVEQAIDYLEHLHFSAESIEYLRSLGMFDEGFFDYLARFRFTGEVWAMPEGELAFAAEPILRVTAPLVEAQIVETFLLNTIAFQTMIASKAARCAIATNGKTFVDFSPRRDHGADAALKAARASYVGGASATSLVLGGQVYGLRLSGTMAHSYVMTFDEEEDAFRCYARQFPDNAILLIDTYDTEEGARKAVKVAHELAEEGVHIRGVRLDSGDLAELARSVRAILDEGGLPDVKIFASGDLDEYRIAELLQAGAPIDAFGVGTQLGTSGDAPSLGAVYKLVEDVTGPKIKLSMGKITLPGRKQVHRVMRGDCFSHDVIALEDEAVEGGRPLLEPVMRDGHRLRPPAPLDEARQRCHAAVAQLPEGLRLLHGSPDTSYAVQISDGLEAMVRRLTDLHRRVP